MQVSSSTSMMPQDPMIVPALAMLQADVMHRRKFARFGIRFPVFVALRTGIERKMLFAGRHLGWRTITIAGEFLFWSA